MAATYFSEQTWDLPSVNEKNTQNLCLAVTQSQK